MKFEAGTRRLIALGAMTLLNSSTAFAGDGLCQTTLNAMGSSAIHVSIGPNRLLIKGDMSADEITKEVHETGSTVEAAIGMTQYSNRFKLTPKIFAIPHPSGYGSCYRQELEVNLASEDTIVHIAKEYPKGRCGYQAILDHEMLHVDAYDSFLRYLAREVEQKFGAEYEKTADFSLSSGWAAHQTPAEPKPDVYAFISTEFQKMEQIQNDIDQLEVNKRLFADLAYCENVRTAVVRSAKKGHLNGADAPKPAP